MPPKTPKQSKTRKNARDIPNESSLTNENFEKELQDLRAKAKDRTPLTFLRQQLSIIVSAAAVLTLAAIYSNISQLTLSPVYGSIPSSIWHSGGITAACFLGWSGAWVLGDLLPVAPIKLLPVIAIYIPVIQSFLFRFSSTLGATYGPLITELLTFFPLLLLSSSSAALILDNLDTSSLDKRIADAAPGVGSFAFYRGMEIVFGSLIRQTIGTSMFLSRLSFQAILGLLYCHLSFSPLLLATVPAFLHTASFNPHTQLPRTTRSFNSTLALDGYSLLARQDSVTGYISVLENTKQNFRVLRCDHSLLGGEWLTLPQGLLPGTSDAAEPIFAVFTMLEAVRLIEVPVPDSNKGTNALVIGLGIGTTPAAFIKHGINTTVVEIDPVVERYATIYFGMPEGHTVIADAVTYVDELISEMQDLDADQLNAGVAKFDYIVHDVFSGGAEPVDLFTVEFLQNLHKLLKPHGTIAINYAGDLLLPSARITINTIKSVFPSCRLYREMPAGEVTPDVDPSKSDFNNMVIFCRKTAAPINFRPAVEADYLKSASRREFLVPKHEIGMDTFKLKEEDGDILSRVDTKRMLAWQREDAVGHWNIMRRVIPASIWELW